MFEKALNNIDINKIEAFVNLIHVDVLLLEKVVVKIKGKECIISPGQVVQVACGMPYLTSTSDIPTDRSRFTRRVGVQR